MARYTAYGQARIDQETVTNPLRFQGQYFDQETGLHYNHHRYYTPDSGRYLTPDPVKLAGGLNSYRYVLNPTGWVDPLGLNGCPGGDGCKPAAGVEDPAQRARIDSGTPATPSPTSSIPRMGDHREVYAKKPIKPQDVTNKWEDFLGVKPYTDIHPRTGVSDPDRLLSADGKRSIRYGAHEMKSKPSKHHYHQETWTLNLKENVMNVDNSLVRAPLQKK